MSAIWQQLLPPAEADQQFHEHIRRLNRAGLTVLAILEVVIALWLLLGGNVIRNSALGGPLWPWRTALLFVSGGLTLALSPLAWSARNGRTLAWCSTFLAAASFASYGIRADAYAFAYIAMIVLVAISSVAFQPWHTLALGLALETVYFLSSRVPAEWEISTVGGIRYEGHVYLILLSIMGCVLSAVNHAHHRSEYQAKQEAVRIAEALSGAQLRAQLAESAVSIGKMAAALSHEINSPLGTLRSSIATLVSVADRQADAPPEMRQKLADTRAQLRRSIDESAARIENVSARLRRFVNLEEADLKSADVNDLLSDVTLLHQEEIRNRRIQLEVNLEKPIPRIRCRPQLLSAVFSSVLSNAIQAVDGDGRIELSTHLKDLDVEIVIRDHGRGMSADEVDTMFDPSFKVNGGRVASGNWSLFNTRQIIYEHGGEIRVETEQGAGTTVHVLLPLTATRA